MYVSWPCERCCSTQVGPCLHVKAGMTLIAEDGSDWRMADVIWVDGGARNPRVPTLFQVAEVYTGVINWINADLVTRICPRF